jgi:hypothetical protein
MDVTVGDLSISSVSYHIRCQWPEFPKVVIYTLMSFIGPELPSHHKNDETSQKGPRIPTHQSTLNIYDEDDDDDDGPKLAVTIGPSIPTPGPSTEKRQVGPTFPSYAPTYDPTTYDDGEDDDDEFGPKPLPAGMQHQQTDAVKEFIEREEKRRKLAEVCTNKTLISILFSFRFEQDAAKPKSLQRDEWMLVPPSSSSLLGSESVPRFSSNLF